MNTLKKLTCLTLALSLGACNEKVSPELQGAASSTTTNGGGSTNVVQPDEFYFRLVNSADTMLNYRLHKTGAGNANSKCQVTNTMGLSSDIYRSNQQAYDITCFLEAEELALWYNGLSYSIEASKNTCEYIGYGPYSYYNYQPGTSTQTVVVMECADNVDQGQADTQMNAQFGITANYACNRVTNTEKGIPFDIDSPAELCKFNHSLTNPGAPNCDVGTITVKRYMVTRIDTDNDSVLDTTKITSATQMNPCGGAVASCIKGPIKLEPQLASSSSGIMVTASTLNAPYSKKYELKGPLNDVPTLTYVNYRRDLASLNIEYGNSRKPLSSSYMSSFGDPIYKYDYDPNLMMQYSNNLRMDGSTLVTGTDQERASDILTGGVSRSIPFAAEPFLGFGNNKTNPFYSFYCFDAAFDVKARIRMIVRDWDRVLPLSTTSESLARISDIDLLPPLARQDVPYTDEVTGDPDSWNGFNDMWDWDDFISMERDDAGVGYDPSITIWRTYPVAPYDMDPTTGTSGFFNPRYFPKHQ